MADSQGSSTVTISKPPADVWAVVLDVAAMPEWASALKKAVVDSVDEHGRPAQASFTIDAGITRASYTLAYTYDGAPDVMTKQSWTLVTGDVVKANTGSYEVVAAGSGSTVTYSLAVEIALKVPGFLKRKGEKAVLESGTKDLKERVEG